MATSYDESATASRASAVQQGPDLRPLDYQQTAPHSSSSSAANIVFNPESQAVSLVPQNQSTVPLNGAADGMHRISIMQDDDDENENTTQPISKSIKPKVTIKKTKANSSLTGKKPLIGAYELEKALIQAQSDIASLHTVLDKLSAKDCSKIFASVIEPDVLYLLLNGLLLIADSQPTKENADKAWQWLDAVRQLSGFRLLYSLMPQEQKYKLSQGIASLPPWADGESVKRELVCSAFSS